MIPLKDDNPTSIQPVITLSIIGLCVLVFLWQLSLSPEGGRAAVYALGFIPAVLSGNAELPPLRVMSAYGEEEQDGGLWGSLAI